MKRIFLLILTLFSLLACSSNSKNNEDEPPKEEEITQTVEMSTSIRNGSKSHLSYMSSGYEYSSDGGLKLWYTLRNSDVIDYTEARVTAYIYVDNRFVDIQYGSLGIFKTTLKVNESYTYCFYLLKSDIKNASSISIKINDTSCSNSDLDLFRVNGIVETYNMTLKQEINTLNVYTFNAIFLTSNKFISYRRTIIYCYADIIDSNGKLITFILLSGTPDTEYIENNQRILLSTDFNMKKDKVPTIAGVIFTASFS